MACINPSAVTPMIGCCGVGTCLVWQTITAGSGLAGDPGGAFVSDQQISDALAGASWDALGFPDYAGEQYPLRVGELTSQGQVVVLRGFGIAVQGQSSPPLYTGPLVAFPLVIKAGSGIKQCLPGVPQPCENTCPCVVNARVMGFQGTGRASIQFLRRRSMTRTRVRISGQFCLFDADYTNTGLGDFWSGNRRNCRTVDVGSSVVWYELPRPPLPPGGNADQGVITFVDESCICLTLGDWLNPPERDFTLAP